MVNVLICPSESSTERGKVSHVIVTCKMINYHPYPVTQLRDFVSIIKY